jgi:four helix bundle protein
MHNFRNLHIWQKSRLLVSEVYKITESFPKKETWGLISQVRRASISISSNIAEGSGKSSNKDFTRFLEMALSSCFEVETQLILSFDLGYISEDIMNKVCSELQDEQKMIYKFIQSLKNEV